MEVRGWKGRNRLYSRKFWSFLPSETQNWPSRSHSISHPDQTKVTQRKVYCLSCLIDGHVRGWSRFPPTLVIYKQVQVPVVQNVCSAEIALCLQNSFSSKFVVKRKFQHFLNRPFRARAGIHAECQTSFEYFGHRVKRVWNWTVGNNESQLKILESCAVLISDENVYRSVIRICHRDQFCLWSEW